MLDIYRLLYRRNEMPQHNSRACKIAVRTLFASSVTGLVGSVLFEASPAIVIGAAVLAGYGMFKRSKAITLDQSIMNIKPPTLK